MAFPYHDDKNCCFFNTYINTRNCYKDLNLKIKIGRMFINGEPNYTTPASVAEVEADWIEEGKFSAHCWAEDENGNVYDTLHLSLVKVKLEATTKKDCKKGGLRYEEYSKDIQTKMFLLCLPSMRGIEKEERGLYNTMEVLIAMD